MIYPSKNVIPLAVPHSPTPNPLTDHRKSLAQSGNFDYDH